MRNLEFRDVEYKNLLNEKLQMDDGSEATRVQSKELGEQIPVN